MVTVTLKLEACFITFTVALLYWIFRCLDGHVCLLRRTGILHSGNPAQGASSDLRCYHNCQQAQRVSRAFAITPLQPLYPATGQVRDDLCSCSQCCSMCTQEL